MNSYTGFGALMNFNIYLNSELGAALKRLAKRRKLTRNALIRKAVEELLEKETHSQVWSEAVLQWQGDPQFSPFESHRTKLAKPLQDPLG
jgi:predicted transcriptional regulator